MCACYLLIWVCDMVIRTQDSAPGDKGTNQSITPHQSFTDLVYSKGKRVSAIVWVPGKKGMVAVACTQPLSADERLENAGRVENSAVLIWNFLDPIHPQYVCWRRPLEPLAPFACETREIVLVEGLIGQPLLNAGGRPPGLVCGSFGLSRGHLLNPFEPQTATQVRAGGAVRRLQLRLQPGQARAHHWWAA